MRVDAFDFHLPPERIALRPADPRESARLLVVGNGASFDDRTVRDLPQLLDPGDILVFNDTKVIPAQLHGRRIRNGASAGVDATLHMRISPSEWKAFLRPAKRVEAGESIRFGEEGDVLLEAIVSVKGGGGEVTLAFDRSGTELDHAIAAVGHIPLPPYIASRRLDDAQDRADYQTVYAREEGAVAAPTAGLHFTPALIAALAERGIQHVFVTLHAGAGTFLPVKVDDTAEHRMHAERGYISADTADRINAARASGGKVVAVGTTSLRLLESAAQADGTIRPWEGATDIFITPGYRFRTADALMTNFHLPRSTLFMLVSAFCGLETMRAAYRHAIEGNYRFYSYGDTSLLWRRDE